MSTLYAYNRPICFSCYMHHKRIKNHLSAQIYFIFFQHFVDEKNSTPVLLVLYPQLTLTLLSILFLCDQLIHKPAANATS